MSRVGQATHCNRLAIVAISNSTEAGVHNIVHNMDDNSVPLPNHVTARNGVYQYVRRVPDCKSAWNKDPVSGVIGVQTGPL